MLSLYSPSEIAEKLAQRIKSLRLTKAWSQAEISKRTGIALPTYRVFERTGQISLERFIRLVDVLGLSDELIRFGEPQLAQPKTMRELLTPRRKHGKTSR